MPDTSGHDTAHDQTGYDWSAYPPGLLGAISLPGLVMGASFLGFGALLRDLEVELAIGLLTVLSIWALPGQVVLVTMMAHGAAFLFTALAVTLTAVRLLPMVVLVLTNTRLPDRPRWPEFLLAHFTAVTVWVIANNNMAGVTRARRLPWLLGLGSALIAIMMCMTALGYVLAELLPPLLSACLVFLTPAFFFISMFQGARYRFDYWAIAFGAGLSPLAIALFPSFDLFVSGVVGGSLAFFLFHGRRGGRPVRWH